MVNLVGRMSLGEILDIDLEEPDTDKRNPNGITRCQSMMVNEDQHRKNWTKIRETSSVTGDTSCSQWVEQSPWNEDHFKPDDIAWGKNRKHHCSIRHKSNWNEW